MKVRLLPTTDVAMTLASRFDGCAERLEGKGSKAMRIVSITLAFLLFVLAGLSLAVDASLTPPALASYAALVRPWAPWAIAGIALLLFLAVLFDRRKAARAPVVAEPISAMAVAAVPKQAEAEVVSFLGLLQEKGRLVDFLMDDITGYTDAQVGAAGRVLHEGCKAVLQEHFAIKPLRDESEGAKVTIPSGYAPGDYRLVGKISGEAPFTGTLVHHGWKTEWVKLPRLIRMSPDRPPAIAPAEVELG